MRLVGQHIKQYRILEKLNGKDAGTVFKALDGQKDEVRVVKLLKPALRLDREFVARFDREIRRLMDLRHPNIATIHAFHSEDPHPFIVMEYVEGTSLGVLIRRDGPMKVDRILALFKQILQGLSYAHRQDVMHRNIKPSNILVTDEGVVKLTDFGLAKRQDGKDLIVSATPVETLHYLSPEHVRSLAEVDHRSDLYAVGMALYEALTGRTPFQQEDTAYIVMRAIVEEVFVPPTVFVPEIPQELAEVAMKALAKAPEDRYQQADEMLAALEAVEAKVPEATYEPQGAPRARLVPWAFMRSAGPWINYGAIVLALLVTVALSWWALRDILETASNEVQVGRVKTVTIQPGVYARILSSVGAATSRQGMLLLKAVPFGTISVTGYETGEDNVEMTVAAGRHPVTFTHPMYGTRTVVVSVEPGQRKEVICYYEGYIRVEANDENGIPLHAELFVNEQGTGQQTPLEAPYPLSPGVYMVEVFLENYLGGVTYIEVHPAVDDTLLNAPPVETLDFALQRVNK